MHLKQLQIIGFKSFADRVRLDFEPGMTSIVGPNGCGKSNVIDAFRWCLGEMSAKSLRSNLMMDVVFNGSGARPPQNMAEVTLTFDNDDKRLPIDYAEVSITRRLFRSGESEYYINKTQCRLRDVRELFLDTGMGEDGYSSMEQGKVEWILQAKPEERRELFEEAAGVSKYRARREEASRKLEKVELDLSRITDIVTITADQIRKLENAVNRARTYERIRGELKVMEIGDWLAHIDQHHIDLKINLESLETASKQAEELNTRSHQLGADLAELRRKMAETEEELLAANGVLSGIDADVKIGEERLSNAKQREQELEQQILNIRESIEREENRVVELKEQEARQQSAFDQFKSDQQSIETTYLSSKTACESALTNLETKGEEIKSGRDQILERAQERSHIQQKISHLTSDTSRLNSQIESSRKELDRIQENRRELDTARSEVEKQQTELNLQMEEKSSALEGFTRIVAELNGREQALQDNLLTISEQIAKLSGQIHSIEEQQKQDPYLVGTKTILTAPLSGIYGPVGRLFRCEDAHRDIVSAAIGDHLGDLVAETMEDAQHAIDYLTSTGKGRCRIWIMDKLPEITPDLASISDIPNQERLMSQIQCEEKFRPFLSYLCSTMWIQGNTIYGTALLNGGVDPSQWQTHVTLRLPELQASLESKEKNKTNLEQSLVSVGQKISENNLNRENVLKELEEVKVRIELANEEQGKLAKKIGLLDEEQNIIQQERTRTNEDLQNAQMSLEEGQNRFNQLEEQEKNDHARLDILQQELTELQHMHASANADLSTKLEQYNSYQEKLSWHQSVLHHSQNDLSHIQNSLQQHQESVTATRNDIENAKTSQGEAENLIHTSLEKRKTAADRCSGIQNVRVELASQIQGLESNLSEAQGELNTLHDDIQARKINEASLKGRLESLEQKLMDQYELSLEAARKDFQAQSAVPDILEKLKKRVSGMGPINLAAPQEHAELVEKNTFLTTQRDDLVKAKEDLKQVITKINATTREHFRETFDKVRENFRQIYSQLFRGGEADLRLTNELDILSSGIDIFCQPPGKKLLHISLLSGGEKALTAAALLFAFFQVRPSPVALLDEVDAPLDESNVLRFLDMLKTFTDHTQFLIITHNKRTMEATNNLYGVTMEELGVSKILSARLQKKKVAEETPVEPEPAAV